MTFIIEIVSRANGESFSASGTYVRKYDPDAHDGRGFVDVVLERHRAKRFGEFGAAMDYWRQASTVRPLRKDGKPNRPLTAFTVVVRPLNQREGEEWEERTDGAGTRGTTEPGPPGQAASTRP